MVDLLARDLIRPEQFPGVELVEPALFLVILGVGPLLLGGPTLLRERFPGRQVLPVVVPLDVLDPAVGLGGRQFDTLEVVKRIPLL